ncbi:MAG: hypothetical protein FJ276_15815 [Planctomycetes bacterium]|nr:hypothetical protein [Planctomycetota bacterium]
METQLHRQLKQLYAARGSRQEESLGGFRIDVMTADRLIEIQHGSLAAIRHKTVRLLADHRVLIVKPIVARKRIIKLQRRGGDVVSQRWSPKRGQVLDLFEELVFFTRVFPHPNLVLEVPLVEVEERRYPGHGNRRWRRPNDHEVEDLRLVRVASTHQFSTAADLLRLLPTDLPEPFHTGQLAHQLHVARRVAQRIAYCIRQTGAAVEVGKQGNARLYRLNPAA